MNVDFHFVSIIDNGSLWRLFPVTAFLLVPSLLVSTIAWAHTKAAATSGWGCRHCHGTPVCAGSTGRKYVTATSSGSLVLYHHDPCLRTTKSC